MEILSVKNLSFTYPENDKRALSDVSFCLNSGDFLLLCGKTGSGKTTLLKMLKKEIAPFGETGGDISFCGKPLSESSSEKIGFVMQNPESQIVCDKVWHELSFGLENAGVAPSQIRRRVAEAASYFGISGWFDRDTCELSGGEKQILNLASVMVTNPKLLLLDEPTAQLDPLAGVRFLNTVKRINDDFGTTVIICEHDTHEIMPLSDKMMIIDDGLVVQFGAPDEVCKKIKDERIFSFFPPSAKIWKGTGAYGECPLNVKRGREYLEKNFSGDVREVEVKGFSVDSDAAVKCKNVCFRYSQRSRDILSEINMTVYKGEVHCILGANGAGKTTLLKIIGGLLKPYRGKVKIGGGSEKKSNRQKASVLPQDVRTIFLKDSVKDDFICYCRLLGMDEKETETAVRETAELFGISALADKHPFDLSGGEQQKCAVAKLLLARPDIILMDEPVKSLDPEAKDSVARIIASLSEKGVTVIIVTHDTEFAARVSDRCSLLFDGKIAACGEPHEFFTGNSFYTTSAARISRGFFKNAVTDDEVISLCLKNKERKM